MRSRCEDLTCCCGCVDACIFVYLVDADAQRVHGRVGEWIGGKDTLNGGYVLYHTLCTVAYYRRPEAFPHRQEELRPLMLLNWMTCVAA